VELRFILKGEACWRLNFAPTSTPIVSNLIELFAHDLRRDTPADDVGDISPQAVSELLRAGRCPAETLFDTFLPVESRVVSWQFWTPLVVVLRVAKWLEVFGVRSVVDIGSGAGKFCVAAALASNCRFTGMEQRPRLVSTARELAKTFEVDDRVTFIEAVFGEANVPEADLYYMFNPFGENIFEEESRLDDDVELSDERYERDTSAATNLLLHAKVGTYFITYNGFGGEVPDGYVVLAADRELPNVLRLWKKVRETDASMLEG
jgi:SAM-dependent methyltransferase